MTTLKESLAQRSVPIRCVEKESCPVAIVRLCPWQGKEWALPWSRLDALSFCRDEEEERIELFFPHHHVMVVGENLRGILESICAFEVSCLRDLPAAHRANLELRESFIARLEVRVQANPWGPSRPDM